MAKDFFISYHSSDRPWADWIAWVLEENGFTIRLRPWDFQLEGNIILNLHMASSPGAQNILVLLSETYLQTQEPIDEWPDLFNARLESGDFRLISICVDNCRPSGALAAVPAINVFQKSETEAEQVILEAIATYFKADSPLSPIGRPVPKGDAKRNRFSSIGGQQQTLLTRAESIPTGQFKLQRRTQTVRAYVERFVDNIGLEMVQIPAGSFRMGSPNNELKRQDREGPEHRVSLASFFIGKYPITQAQWRFVARLPSVNHELRFHPSHFTRDSRPVENVSWFEAVEFCDRLSLHTSRLYRLPTEAEWEYACRAGTTTPFHFGETITTDLANYSGADEQHGAYGRGPKGQNRQTTTPVDHFGIANAFGLCDMHGNVWEWCQDLWRANYGDDSPKRKIKATPQPDQSTHRVARGGSWYTTPQRCRSASRIHFAPESRHSDVGFRVVCSFGK
ncbi:SUMF1/EgtB/PvdO family nonheme iron enzyme [Nodosilinea sp. PGN35]|uniref:SUMF1/EgtB/PvdO family nonheme iron enzyme n=1 Tax=Nodosilinea sp. PGN35 TaxID=3020489 RepID=UPI0023B244FB|nr:SUMF1/EgtB/PvdO family nonheme iron enzyme [Nodosilinea sp. TSF1-S3]MDF0368504.1 SUMF1/EgtB/PvdO family nonheme iron enzyme [Nodosilinea sp. TSF1-S3]